MSADDGRIDALAGRLSAPGSRKRRRAARRLAGLRSPAAVGALAQAFASSDDRRVARIAAAALSGLDDPASVDAVCEVLIATGAGRLQALADSAGYRHSDPARRAVQLFLRGEFERYAELDADGGMLAAARNAAGDGLRARLAGQARAAGRVEWLRAVVGARHGGRLGGLSDPEWEAAIAILVAAGRWEELWRLATHAPPRWGVRMLRELDPRNWLPADGAERAALEELTGLCRAIAPDARPDPPTGLPRDQEINALAMTPDGTLLAAASRHRRGPVRLWRLPSGEPAGELNVDGDQKTWDMLITGDGATLARATPSGVSLWRLPTGTRPPTLLRRLDSRTRVRHLAEVSNGRFLVGASGREVLVWRMPEGRLIGRAIDPGASWTHARSLIAPPAGDWAACVLERGEVRVWAVPDAVPTTTLGALDEVSYAVTTRGGELAAGCGWPVRVWHMPSGEHAALLLEPINCLTIAPDGGLLATAGEDRTVKLWRLPSGEPAAALAGHEHTVTTLAMAPDGELLASGDHSGTVRLWRIPSGEPAGVLSGRHSPVTQMTFGPDGGLLVTAAHDGSVRLWPAALHRALHTPVEDISPAMLQALRNASTGDAWARLIAALVRWRRYESGGG